MAGKAEGFYPAMVLGFLLLAVAGAVTLGLLHTVASPKESVDFKERLPKATRRADSTALRFAVATMVSPQATFTNYKRIVEIVGRRIGKDTVLVIRPSYKDVRKALQEGSVDVAFVCTGTYALLAEGGEVELVATPEFQKGAVYKSVIIVPADSSAKTIHDLKGRSFAFTDPESCTGEFVPRCLLAQFGYSHETFFGKTVYTGSHDRSVMAVTNHVVDAAAVDYLVLHRMYPDPSTRASRVRVIWQSEQFGAPPVVVPRALGDSMKKALRREVVSLHSDNEASRLMGEIGITRFKLGDPSDYDTILKLYRSQDQKD